MNVDQDRPATASAQGSQMAGALRASERDFRYFFESAGVGNVIADARSFIFLRVNRQFCEITGYSAEELQQMTAYDITHPDDVALDRVGWDHAVRQEPPTFSIEKRYRRKDGQEVWVQVTSTLVRDEQGSPLHAIGVIRDVTDRRQAEEKLRHARAQLEDRVESRTKELAAMTRSARATAHRYETFVNLSPLPIVGTDEAGIVKLWNPAAEALFGWASHEVLNQPLPVQFADRAGQTSPSCSSDRSAQFVSLLETRRSRRDGPDVYATEWHVPLVTPDGQVDGRMMIINDCTETRFLERAFLEVAERENRRIGQELHDHLCQLLLGAAFSTKAIATSLPTGCDASQELADLAKLINSAMQQTRDVARGLCPVDFEAAGLATALRELTLRPRAGVVCHWLSQGELDVKEHERARHLYHIADEAIDNAVKHSGCTEMTVSLSSSASHAILEVADNGHGYVAEDHLPRAGLGLAIMKYRARAIGARLEIDTTKQAGTTVKCMLPF